MTETTIKCPHCGKEFSLSDVQKHELEDMRDKMSKELEAGMKKDFDERARVYAEKVKLEADQINKKQSIELDELRRLREDSQKKELLDLAEKQKLERQVKDFAFEKEKAVLEAKKQAEEDLEKKSQAKIALEIQKIQAENDKKNAEKEEQMNQLRKSLEEANRKANQGSMQIQGEIQEDALKNILISNFPIDTLSDVEKGIEWADLVQNVRNELGHTTGIIAWESKNTKSWSDKWITKLREDRLKVNASISIIVTNVLPKGINHFGSYHDIWVTEWAYVIPLTILLRSQIIELSKTRNSLEAKDEKMEYIYKYLISPEFKSKIENIVEAFKQMQEQVEEERRAFEWRWKKREQLLSQVLTSTSGFYGDLQWLIGSNTLPKVDYLELWENGILPPWNNHE